MVAALSGDVNELQTSGAPTVLVVDDEQGAREALRVILEPEFRVLVADGGEAALTILGREPVSVMTLDLRMPGLSGSETLLAVREADADVEVVVVTGFGTYPDALRALRLRALEFVTKPFDASRVREAVRQAHARREQRLGSSSADERDTLSSRMLEAVREFERTTGAPRRRSGGGGFSFDGDDQQNVFAENVVLPEQLQNARSLAQSGEFGLLWAVFLDGIQTYCEEILAGSTTSLAYREVERWIFRPSSDAVTAFSNLCDLFGADAQRLRRALALFREHPNPAILELLNLRAA